MSQDSTLKSVGLYDRRAHFVQAMLFRKVSIFVCLASDCTMHSMLVYPVSPFELLTCFNSPFFFILSYCLGSMKECCWMILLLIFFENFPGVRLLTWAGHLTCGIYICLPLLTSDHCGKMSAFLMLSLA